MCESSEVSVSASVSESWSEGGRMCVSGHRHARESKVQDTTVQYSTVQYSAPQ